MPDVIEELKQLAGTPDPPPKPAYVRGKVESYSTRLSYSLPETDLNSPPQLVALVASDMASLLQFAAWDESMAIDLLDRLRKSRDYYCATFGIPGPQEFVVPEE